MSDLLPIPALPPARPEPQRRPSWWERFTHPRAVRQARLLAAHHAWTTERARHAQIDLVRAGFHLGPVPYGYLPHQVSVPDQHGQSRRRMLLVLDPEPAAVVGLIFQWRVEDRLTPSAIVTRLLIVDDLYGIADPATGLPRPWTPASVGRILANPVYTGATVWGRTHAGRPVPPEHWVVCLHAHRPIIDGRTFYRAQLLAPPGQGVFSPHLPSWEMPPDPPTDPGTGSGNRGVRA
ncbi:recombinase family protein [Pseudofrankia sp. DC12]|uniref:recombinase family protein n=1 Tax=Pseudofrankia sp. DC12 TaxID=683315 RepID=UPI0005F816FA|nr:recombinase family protein [Pseudofrankia sp. DC12]